MTTGPDPTTLSERERFVIAFDTLVDRGEFPTPTKLNTLMQRSHRRNHLAGRLSNLRRLLLQRAGYRQSGPGARWKKED